MADHEVRSARGLFGGVFARGAADTGDTAWLQAMLDAEAGLARALERAGLAPAGSGAAVTEVAQAGNFDADELGELAALTGNPVPALARALARRVPQTAAGAVHRGATSQDIVDTAVMLLAKRAIDVVLADLAQASAAAARLADAHRSTIMIGRTLLQQAVPVTFGLVAAGWLTSLDEARAGLAAVSTQRLAVQFGGAAGTLASLGDDGPRVVALLAEELGLARPVLPWHTDRLRIIDLATALVRVTAALGKIARDVTLLAQSEIGEVSEGSGEPGPADAASPRRGGSSAMPHKHNPVAAIAILGCTRQAPGLLATLAACAEQELQRAAGAWHAEWEPLTALLRLTGSAASWAAELMSGLVVDAARMAANLAATKDLPLAEHVTSLLAGVLGGVQAHDLVAEAGQRAVSAGLPLRDVLLAVPKLESPWPQRASRRSRLSRPSSRPVTSAPPTPSSPPPWRPMKRLMPSYPRGTTMDDAERARQGMTVRRAVLGDEHVDRAAAGTSSFTEPFQDFITRYAWGDVWSRPGLSRAERSMITLAMLAALQHENELAMHVRAALRNGLSPEQIQEVLLQVAVYAGVPAANRAFAVAQRVLAEVGAGE
jgi:3-carboxy-cis,cis-muconate cycloisomerase